MSKERIALEALNKAALAIAGNLALDKVLRQIVDSACSLVQARYAALGVPDAEGKLIEFIHTGLSIEQANAIGRLPEGKGLLGAIMVEKKAIRLEHLHKDYRSVGFPKNHPPMRSFLGVPIMAGSQVLGNLYLTDKMGAPGFSASDEALIQLFAAHAAIAIQNAQLYEQVARLAVVEERTRIGMDLHDGVIQAIYAVGLTLESVRLHLGEEQEDTVMLINQAIGGLNEAITDIRNFILDLRPRRFEGDLQHGLARLVREFQANTMIPVIVSIPQKLSLSVPPDAARALFFTAQEGLANVARHAKANKVKIILREKQNWLTLTIEDDGQGFDTSNQYLLTGHGLANMRARAEEGGGVFQVESEPAGGTRIFFSLPIQF